MEQLKEFREKWRLSQAKLSVLLGTGQNNISEWERGIVKPRNPTILSLALERLDQILTLERDIS